MSIWHGPLTAAALGMSYVACDVCGTPGDCGDDAREARASARKQGFVRVKGRDLCAACFDNKADGMAD